MKVIKYETIKKNALEEFFLRSHAQTANTEMVALAIIGSLNPPRPFMETLEKWRDYGEEIIKNWDIRCVKKLIECFPGCVPNYCRSLPVVCDYDESGDWACVFG